MARIIFYFKKIHREVLKHFLKANLLRSQKYVLEILVYLYHQILLVSSFVVAETSTTK